MPAEPLAFFITFHTYGSWLHGAEKGSVDRENNRYGAPFVPADGERKAVSRAKMSQPVYLLDEPRRFAVRDGIVAGCKRHSWILHALHVRTNHVHLVVTADRDPETVMKLCKTGASQALNRAGFDDANRKTLGRSRQHAVPVER